MGWKAVFSDTDDTDGDENSKGLGQQASQFGTGLAAPDDQPRPALGERALQGRQAVVQPPAAGAAHCPAGGIFRRIDEHRNDALGGRQGCQQGGIVGQPEVAPEPDDGRAGRHGDAPGKPHAPAAQRRRKCHPANRA